MGKRDGRPLTTRASTIPLGTARVRDWFARTTDVFRAEPTTQAGALALLSFVGENMNLYNDGKEEGPGAILRSVAVLNAWTN